MIGREVIKRANLRGYSAELALYKIGNLADTPLVNRVVNLTVEFEVSSDDGAPGESSEFGGVFGVESRSDKDWSVVGGSGYLLNKRGVDGSAGGLSGDDYGVGQASLYGVPHSFFGVDGDQGSGVFDEDVS